jgi:MFS family permease
VVPFRDALTGIPLRLICLLVVGHVAFSGSRLSLTLRAVALDASPLAIGILMSLMMVLPMLLSVHFGRWSDRYGATRPAAIGLALVAAGCFASGLLSTMAGLYAASLLVGSGYTLTHVAINNAIGQAAPAGQLTRSFSATALGFSLSGISGPLLAGLLIDHAGYRAAFLVLMLFALAALAMLLWRGGPSPAPAVAAPAAAPRVLDLLRDAPLRAVFIASALLSTGWDLFTFLAPLHSARIGLSATATGLVMAAFGVGTFAVRLLLPVLASRLTEWRTLSWAMFVTALCYIAFPLSTTLPLLLLAAFATGLGLGGGQPMSMSLLHLKAPAARAGEAVGVRTAIVSTTQTLMPLLFGALGSAVGVAAVFWATATLLAAGGAFASRRG